jgi:hypothetical protein
LAAGETASRLAAAGVEQHLTVASLLRRYAPDFVATHPRQAVPQVQSTLAKLSLCRTAALGGHCYQCDACRTQCLVYNSCGDRHCPQCAGARRADWVESAAQLLLPGVDYFQVVFTIPDQLSSLALGNRREIYDLLFRSAWQSLSCVIAREQGFEAAAVLVLHTWNQKLEPHAHVHALVPGGGPALSGPPRWIRCQRPNVPHCDGRYLVNAEDLRSTFRQTFLSGLRRLQRLGSLKLDGEWSELRAAAAFEAWLKPLEELTWVTYIEPPPTAESTPEQVLKYLARYLTGGPISDRRLISHENGSVTFLARTGTTTGGGDGESEPYTLTGVEFVFRWSLHILPKGYTKTRRFGGYSNRHSERYLDECQSLLSTLKQAGSQLATTDDASLKSTEPCVVSESSEPCCPQCHKRMRLVAEAPPASWWRIMNSPWRPPWYSHG